MNNEDFYWKQDFEELVSMCMARDNKIAELKETIDKAKEYIKNNYRVLLLTEPPREAFDINELLAILGDKANE